MLRLDIKSGTIVLLLFIGLACKENPPEPRPYAQSITLSAEDIGVTEAWLKVHFVDTSQSHSFVLKRDSTVVFHGSSLGIDTIVFSDSLLPSHPYSYRAYRPSGTTLVDSSELVSITTMDTTSHAFTWQIDTLGDGNGSNLQDVTIVNDTLIYAVGEVYYKDSSGQFNMTPLNFEWWNGRMWKFDSITYVPLRAVLGFSSTDIWACSSAPYHFDGISWVAYDVTGIFNGYVNSIGTLTTKGIYIAGTNGSIAHFNGTSWQQIESGTTVDLQDVWGGTNRRLGQDSVVLFAASNKYQPGEKKLLRLNQRTGILDSLSWPMQDRRLHSVWFDRHSNIYVCGGGIFVSRDGTTWQEVTTVPLIFTNSIRGNAGNDIFVAGDFGIVAHFNGISWHVYPELALSNGVYYSMAFQGNQVIAVGNINGTQAIVARGTR